MTARIVCPPGAGSQSLRKFLICGWSRVTVDADDHVDATDDGARGRLRQAGYGDMSARNVEQVAGRYPQIFVQRVTKDWTSPAHRACIPKASRGHN